MTKRKHRLRFRRQDLRAMDTNTSEKERDEYGNREA